MNTIATLAPVLGVRDACRHLGLPRHLTRSRKTNRPRPPAHRPACAQKRALTPEERQTVLDLLNGQDFADVTPYQAATRLLESGRYVCSTECTHSPAPCTGSWRKTGPSASAATSFATLSGPPHACAPGTLTRSGVGTGARSGVW